MSCEGNIPGSNQLKAPRRNRYYYGKMLDELHLRMETRYHNEKRWLLNRLSLGSGVLCGLKVAIKNNVLTVTSGVAIDAWGREIIVPAPTSLDPWKTPDNPCEPAAAFDFTKPVYLCLAYRECQTDFQPAMVPECGAQHQGEAGTIVEGYRLVLSNAAPPEGTNQPAKALCEALSSPDVKDRLHALCESSEACCNADDAPPCVMLARVEVDAAKKKILNIDPCTYRRYAYGNEKLFEMIMCLAAQSGTNGQNGKDGIDGKNGVDGKNGLDGVNGKDGKNGRDGINGQDGLGLFPDLPKILDIAWAHQKPRFYLDKKSSPDFMAPFLEKGEPTDDYDLLLKRIRKGSDVPPFTIYFNRKLNGLNQHTFCLQLKVPIGTMGINLQLGVNGRIIEIDNSTNPNPSLQTPHTLEGYAYAASYIPEREFFLVTLPRILQMLRILESKLDIPQIASFHVLLKGDFIWAGEADKFKEDAVLDADNIGGRVGLNMTRRPPVKGGKNPSGNLTQGGDFESWFDIIFQDKTGVAPAMTNANVTRVSLNDLFGLGAVAAPVNVNLASKTQLIETGFTELQANKIIETRSTKWFTDTADVVRLIKLKPAVAIEMQGKIFA